MAEKLFQSLSVKVLGRAVGSKFAATEDVLCESTRGDQVSLRAARVHLGAWDELDAHHDPLQLAAILERGLEDTERSIDGGFDDLVWVVSLEMKGGRLPTRPVKGQDVSSTVPPMS